jgi:hypothetical protein
VKGINSLDFCPYLITVLSLVLLSNFGNTAMQHLCVPRQATFTMGRGGSVADIQSCPRIHLFSIRGLARPEKNWKFKEINGSLVSKCAQSENGP